MTPSASPAKGRAVRPKRPRHLSPAMRCETAFRLILSECLEEVATNHEAVLAGDQTALHHTRVALTRLKAAIAFYGRMVADPEWSRLKSELKWLSGYLGATRDLDVAIENSKGEPEERVFVAARGEAFERLKDALGSERYMQWFEAMWNWVGSGPWTARQDRRAAQRRAVPVSDFHAGRLARWHKQLAQKSRGLQGMGKNKRHRVRLASKRLRYAIEFSEGGLPEDDYASWKVVLKYLRKGQQVLGELNDADVRLALIGSVDDQEQRGGRAAHKKLGERKKKSRLLRRAAAIYRKISG
ncbi:CHAD domain-containing protein [Bradyrhizobium sp. ISRA443]|uniref:CHAD domain-containing protein n=1 Tax=unclassified Bradyrhizobium TaxID=2631580 RepID=UPI00247A8BD3|nr:MULTISPECIES: CHAD domain-containing protein [unclassified Bradyrhizobium]WGR91068.1 CHAD domain-containing protein [Bradyrhizobium sp. ISRA435]WGS01237.1 CHAD domain-containing protein [Bradyrhizobium sp. ISRA436]WGS08124.1 CHAD domain-containing protein [Bradyrhizobium sp. ISRA437]WGS15012.1 CHAD domain-containing protein [Bradyrhizobium sp. ISRA443]